MGFTVILFTIIIAIFYVWLKRKKYESTLIGDVDLEEPLNGSNDNVSVTNTFYSIFNSLFNNDEVRQVTDTFLPIFLQDNNTDFYTESSPVPYKFTETGNAGFFVYKEDNLKSSENKIIDNQKKLRRSDTTSLNSFRSTNYYSPTNYFIEEEGNKDYYYNEVL